MFRGRCDYRERSLVSNFVGFEKRGRGLSLKECGWSLEAREAKRIDSFLKFPETP